MGNPFSPAYRSDLFAPAIDAAVFREASIGSASHHSSLIGRHERVDISGLTRCRQTLNCPMNIALPRNLEDYVAELVQTSGYKGSDEVVLEALSEHQARRRGQDLVMTPELERLLDEGLENLDQARTTDELRRRS